MTIISPQASYAKILAYTFTTAYHFTDLYPVHIGEPVLSQKRDLLDQPVDFYEPNVLPATQPVMSKHCRKTQWFGRLLFYRHDINIPCLTNSVRALKERAFTFTEVSK